MSYNPIVQSALRIHGFYIQGFHMLRINWLWTENYFSLCRWESRDAKGWLHTFFFVCCTRKDWFYFQIFGNHLHTLLHTILCKGFEHPQIVVSVRVLELIPCRFEGQLLSNFFVCLFLKFCLNLAPRKFFLLLSFVWLSFELLEAVGLYRL